MFKFVVDTLHANLVTIAKFNGDGFYIHRMNLGKHQVDGMVDIIYLKLKI